MEEPFGEIVANHGNVNVVQVLRFGKKSAFLRARVVDPFVRRNRTGELNAVHFVSLVARRYLRQRLTWFNFWRDLHRHVLYVRTLLLDGHCVFVGERLPQPFFRSQTATKTEIPTEDEQRVRAVLIQKATNISVKANHDRCHSDDRHDPDHHAEHG